MTTRRSFVKTAAAAGAALALSRRELFAERRIEPAPKPLKLLILGGTGFTGPHQVRYAVERGHEVTVFNRGRRQADLPASVRHLTGDRNAPDGVAALRGTEQWDAVIDVPTTLPKWVRDAGEALKGRADQYIFISTISTYAAYPTAGMDENSPLAKYSAAEDAYSILPPQIAGQQYGALKVLSELEAEKYFPGKVTVIRPGLIVGPGDPSDRFTYWPVRIEKGGEVLVPGDGTDPVQIIDARDLAEFVIRMAEQKAYGIYNATGPRSPMSMGEMVAGIRGALPGDLNVKFTWVPWDFLTKHQVRGWSGMPTVVPPEEGNDGWGRVSIDRAVAKGLTFRSLADTTLATLEWYHPWFKTLPPERQARPGAGISAAKEAEVLAAWKAAPKA